MKQIFRGMLMSLVSMAALVGYAVESSPPTAYGPTPSPQQLRWHEMEFNALICYGIETYTQKEWGYGNDPVSLFAPTNLDTDQWAKTCKAAGMKGIVFVAKHHDGFCLWPSKFNTDYSVKDVKWKKGQGDVVGDLAKSCKKYGLKLGLYLSPWDRNRGDYGQPSYVDYYHKQLKELMTNYGDLYEFWIDGANGGTGWYGGADERRSIPKSYYQYDKVRATVREHQPDCLIFGGQYPDVRWVGNEAGYANTTHWSRWFNEAAPYGSGKSPDGGRTVEETGLKEGTHWVPTEADTTLLYPKAWYHKAGRPPRNPKQFYDLYYSSIGRNSLFLLGVQIAPSGQIRPQDVVAMSDFGARMKTEFEENFVKGAKITASNDRGVGYEPQHISGDNTKVYWATDDGVRQASLTLAFKMPTTFNRVVLQEYIQLGQRIHEFMIEALVDGQWNTLAKETTIGYKRALELPDTTATKIRVTMTTDAPALMLANLGVYNAPPAPEGGGEKVMSRKSTSIPKTDWKLLGVDSEGKSCLAMQAIDNRSETIWASKWQGQPTPHPHWIAIDLGKVQRIGGFSYLPRSSVNTDGNITDYEFYVSVDGKNWGKPVAQGEFGNMKNNPTEQLVRFKRMQTTRYVKLVATAAVDGKPFTTVAEIGILSAEK